MPKARKPHCCGECCGPIAIGETYEYTAGKWDGDVYQHRICASCLALRAYVTEHVPCFCWAFGRMREDARETIGEYRRELPGLWFGWARHEVPARRRETEHRRQRAAA